MAGLIPTLAQGLATIVLVGGTLAGIDVLETAIEQYAEESDALNQHQQGIVFRVLQIAVLLAAGLATLTVWGVPLGSLAVGAGFLGIVVGTAARSTIGSLIAGFVLMFARPFEIGDWVAIDGDEGIVTDITIINTRMRNAAGEEIVIPNDVVSNATVTNRTSLERLRLSVDVGVDYDADVEAAEAVLGDVLDDVSGVLSNPTPQVVPKSFGDSAVVLECRFWIDHPSAAKRAMTKAAVVREVKRALDEAGIKIPYPQRELLGREESGGLQVAEGDGAESPTPTAEQFERSQ
ncbi:mechanosensitive ion channel family protein [Halomicroarcula sp. F13]|uniref:Mechanosensitive ion channel family protein n=2 Tax=Haloarcula rubra TaxID=2487747 RepID=A0AAW4PYH3_9EURY|nr:mechanosensitive ion channel family protein [Halomicroarcula rubra]